MRAVHYAVLNEIRSLRTIPQAILDVGCGDGAFTRVISAAFPGSSITAVDTLFSKPFLSDNIVFKTGNVEQLPFDSGSFDLVFTVLSLHHWKEKDKGICEIYRVLKNGGRLIIGDPLLEDWMSNRVLGRLMQVLDGGAFADRESISRYLSLAGFVDIGIRLIPNTMKSLYMITARK